MACISLNLSYSVCYEIISTSILFYYFFQESRGSNNSVSRLFFTPNASVDGQVLTCRAENPHVTAGALEDSWRLRVVCKYKYFLLYIAYLSHVCVYDSSDNALATLNFPFSSSFNSCNQVFTFTYFLVCSSSVKGMAVTSTLITINELPSIH